MYGRKERIYNVELIKEIIENLFGLTFQENRLRGCCLEMGNEENILYDKNGKVMLRFK